MMASKAAAKLANGVINISEKQTLQSAGIWELIRRTLAVDKNRSNGVPLNPHYRYPAPGSNDPLAYDDKVTLPAGDIAGNPYWMRDFRRNSPRPSVIRQEDAVVLLSVGSAAAPKAELVGEAGAKALVAATDAGKTQGLGIFLATTLDAPAAVAQDLFVDGLPPTPAGQTLASGQWDVHKYSLETEQSYPEKYPCRSFR